LTAFILLYALHIRSYYEMESGQIVSDAALRFSMNIMGLWAITTGFGVGLIAPKLEAIDATHTHRDVLKWALVMVLVAVVAISFVATRQLRSYEIEDEARSRVYPATSVARFVGNNGGSSEFVATMEPLVVQMYSGAEMRVVDLEFVDVDTLAALVSSGHLIFLKQTDRFSDADINRYGAPVQYMLSAPAEKLMSGEGFQIDRVESANSQKFVR
jgi:hypothetical protein